MDEIQLRMKVRDVLAVADAIERDIANAPPGDDRSRLAQILTWLRYRLARTAARTTTVPMA